MPGTADTAKLLASLELQDKFSGPAAKAMGSVTKLETSFDRIGAAAKRGVGVAAANLTRLGLVAAAGIGTAVVTGLQDLKTLENATTSVDGAIRQLGLTGQVTGAQVADWANQIEANIGAAFDDKAITAATATLIRFGKVTPSNLRPAMQVMTDLAAKTGSVDSAATLLAKALADPEKAAGKLTRAGVILTKAQQDELKALVKSGDAAKAQAMLLDILTQTTKGAAAATQGPYARAISMLADASEDARKALAIGFLPVIEKVATKLQTALANPQVIASIRDFGMALAGSLDSLIGIAERLPWGSIADSLKIAGAGAKAILDAFVGMPPWVQTAVLTGWGLNKLTGGALGDIVGELGKGLIKGVLGMNAGVVNINAAVVNGAGVGAVAGAAEGAASGGLMNMFLASIGGAAFTAAVAGVATVVIAQWIGANAKPGAPPPGGQLAAPGGAGGAARVALAAAAASRNRANPLAASERGLDQIAAGQRAANALTEKQMREVASHAASEHADLDRINGSLATKLEAVHADLLKQLDVLRTSKDPTAQAAAAAAIAASILKGSGGFTSNTNILGQLKTARAGATDPALIKALDDAIAKIARHLPGERWIAAQEAAARKIVAGNAPVKDKIAELTRIQRAFIAHGDTVAAGIIKGEIDSLKPHLDAINTSVRGMTPVVNQQTGFVVGTQPINITIPVTSPPPTHRNNEQAATTTYRWQGGKSRVTLA